MPISLWVINGLLFLWAYVKHRVNRIFRIVSILFLIVWCLGMAELLFFFVSS